MPESKRNLVRTRKVATPPDAARVTIDFAALSQQHRIFPETCAIVHFSGIYRGDGKARHPPLAVRRIGTHPV